MISQANINGEYNNNMSSHAQAGHATVSQTKMGLTSLLREIRDEVYSYLYTVSPKEIELLLQHDNDPYAWRRKEAAEYLKRFMECMSRGGLADLERTWRGAEPYPGFADKSDGICESVELNPTRIYAQPFRLTMAKLPLSTMTSISRRICNEYMETFTRDSERSSWPVLSVHPSVHILENIDGFARALKKAGAMLQTAVRTMIRLHVKISIPCGDSILDDSILVAELPEKIYKHVNDILTLHFPALEQTTLTFITSTRHHMYYAASSSAPIFDSLDTILGRWPEYASLPHVDQIECVCTSLVARPGAPSSHPAGWKRVKTTKMHRVDFVKSGFACVETTEVSRCFHHIVW